MPHFQRQLQFKIKTKLMKLKEKLVREKQNTDRPQTYQRAEVNPKVTKFSHEQLMHNLKQHTGDMDHRKKSVDKENFHGMINSVPASEPQHYFKNNMKASTNSGKRFKTQTGYEPKLTSSRYQGGSLERDDWKMRLSQEQNHFDHEARYFPSKLRKCEKIQTNTEDRPLTFGLIKQNQPLKASMQYKEDRKLKNQVLDEISKFRRSQEGLLGSKQYSNNGEAGPKCLNHPTKKAKYRLITDEEKMEGECEDEMIYCSKCAINLLQQGFKVQELKREKMEASIMKRSKNNGHSRLQELRKFQEKLSEVSTKLQEDMSKTQGLDDECEKMEQSRKQTEHLFDILIDILKQMKVFQSRRIKNAKQKIMDERNKHEQTLMEQIENVECMRGELKEYRNKFIIMKEQQFNFLINSFMNKVTNYGLDHQELSEPLPSTQQQIQLILATLNKTIRQRLDCERSLPESASKKDQFVCSQIKQPFRTLFPQEQYQQQSQYPYIMQVSEENDSPSFQRMNKKY